MSRTSFWVVLSGLVLTASFIATVEGMTGGWDIRVLGVKHGAVWDPGGPYLGSGLLWFEQRRVVFVGHPGLTLMAFCHVVAKALYWLSGSTLPFQQYAGKNIYQVTLAAMLSMTGLWLIAFAVVERLALRVLGNERLAILAVAAFATTYPVLFYLNRISPESLLVVFTMLAFLWLWRYYELHDSPKALGFLALSAQASVAALYTKFQIVAPIILFIPIQILFRRGVRKGRNVRDACLYLLFATPAWLLGAQKVDWAFFFKFWFDYAPGAPRYADSHHWLVNVLLNMVHTAWAMAAASFATLASGAFMPTFTTREGLFFAAEGAFLVVSLVGLVTYWRACRNTPVLLGWFLGFIALTTIPYLQRGPGAWHYAFLQLAVASLFFSYGLARLVHRLTGWVPTMGKGWAASWCALAVVHGLSILLVVNMQRYNADQYKRFWEAYYKAPAVISADGYVGLVNAKTMSEILQPLSTYLPRGYFVHEYEQRFLRVLPEDRDRDVALRARAIEIVVEEGQDHVVTMRMVSGESPKSTATR